MPDLDRLPGHSPTGGSPLKPDSDDLTKDFSTPDPTDSATVAASPSPLRSKAGRYQIGDEIARGGIGIVYRAYDPAVKRDVAVKVLQERFRSNPIATSRFIEEGQITGQLQHPGIPAVHEIGTLSDGSPFMAMKLIKGVTLAEQIGGSSPDCSRMIAVFLQVAQAVGYAHSKEVIHRDLKPANIMVGQFGEVQVMDWGLAKVLHAPPLSGQPKAQMPPQQSIIETGRSSDPGTETQAGSVLGTPAFMSPEQAGGEVERVDERADVFGLGAVLCTILTGDPPYRDDSAEAARLRAVRGQVEDAYSRLDACGADPELIFLCKRCLASDRDNRPRNAGEVAAAVSAHLAAVEDRLRRAERERAAAEVKAEEQRKRRRLQAVVAGAGLLILALLGIGGWWADRQAAEREKDRAVAAERDRQEAAAALGHAEKVLSGGDLAAADLALSQAESRLGADGPVDLHTRLAKIKRDRDLVRDLREIDDLSWVPGYISMPKPSAMSKRYQTAFSRYEMNVAADPGATADLVRESQVSAALISGLSEWFCADPNRPHLRQVLDRLDAVPSRAAIRAAIHAGDEVRVRELVKTLDGSKVPPWFAASIGYHRMVPFEDGVRLMAAAWRTQPTEYVLAYRIAQRLWGTSDDRLGEMLAWARLAVALRPDSPFAHVLLGTAWRGMQKWGEAEASARRAIELSRKYPKYAGAHVGLGNVLLQKGDLDGAEASYRAALAIDPDATGIYFNIGLVYDGRGDLAGAEEWLRKAVAANPDNSYYRGALDRVVQNRAQRKQPNGKRRP